MLKSLEIFLIAIAVMVIVIACNLAKTTANIHYQNLPSKVEFVSENIHAPGNFNGNTAYSVQFKNHEFLVQEQNLKVKRKIIKAEDKVTELPAGGQIEIKIEAASEETADLDKIEIWVSVKGEKKRCQQTDYNFVQGVRFSHIEEQYNQRIYTNIVHIGLKEKIVDPIALEIIDNHIGKTTKFAVYPYYNK